MKFLGVVEAWAKWPYCSLEGLRTLEVAVDDVCDGDPRSLQDHFSHLKIGFTDKCWINEMKKLYYIKILSCFVMFENHGTY